VKQKSPKPTEAELAILQALWKRGAGATVRDVHSDLGERTGYTTILKLMQIMTDKGLVVRDTSQGRTHLYRAAQPEASTQRRLVADLMSRAFGGSARKLVAAALSSRRATPQELEEIRKLIDEMKGDAS
jgi:BlaI family transcriptional regulator, penicillinase repressor